MHKYIYIHLYVNIYIYLHVHTNTHIYGYIHIHIHRERERKRQTAEQADIDTRDLQAVRSMLCSTQGYLILRGADSFFLIRFDPQSVHIGVGGWKDQYFQRSSKSCYERFSLRSQ